MLVTVAGPPKAATDLTKRIVLSIVEHVSIGGDPRAKLSQSVAAKWLPKPNSLGSRYPNLDESPLLGDDYWYVVHAHDFHMMWSGYESLLDEGRKGRLKIIYPTRDLRDSIESYTRPSGVGFRRTVEFYAKLCYPLFPWIEGQMGSTWVLERPYEECTLDLVRNVSEIATFMGVTLTHEEVCGVADAHTKDKAPNGKVGPYGGVSGTWHRAGFSRAELAEIEGLRGGWNARMGYQNSLSDDVIRRVANSQTTCMF